MSAGPSFGTYISLNTGSQSSAVGELAGSDDFRGASQDKELPGQHCRSGSEDSKASTIQKFPSSPPICDLASTSKALGSRRPSASSWETVPQSASPPRSRTSEEGHRSSSEELPMRPDRQNHTFQQNDTPTRQRTQRPYGSRRPTAETANSLKRISSSSPKPFSTVASQENHKTSSEEVPMTPLAKKRAIEESAPPKRPSKPRQPRLAHDGQAARGNKRLRRLETP